MTNVSNSKEETISMTSFRRNMVAGPNECLRRLNKFGKKWSGLITILDVCGWAIGLTLVAATLWQTVQTKLDVQLSQKVLERSFSLQIVSRGETLAYKKTVESSFDCAYYWILFSQNDFVWPQVCIKNTRQPNQQVDVSVTVPQDFSAGELIMAGVPEEVHAKFNKWLKQGENTALLKPKNLTVVFSKPLVTRQGAF